MKTYLSVYFGAAVLAVITTPIVIYIARRLNIVDDPDARKVHAKPVPRKDWKPSLSCKYRHIKHL